MIYYMKKVFLFIHMYTLDGVNYELPMLLTTNIHYNSHL